MGQISVEIRRLPGSVPRENQQTVAGTEIGRRSPQKIVGLGVGRSFQNTSLFDSLTVGDCLRLARYRIDGASAFVRRQTVTLPEPALEILRQPGSTSSWALRPAICPTA
ncbi:MULTISPECIES: hypothetical protein [Aurantimonas]|jgi:branched-chain amino acid transport system permease protein|uniref:hypothetical protein n=1 Tax=Aurantimonas TaxID=182269 RepID=UPI001E3EF2AA|nr:MULTISPECIES: hypothetical protein [Aurantimonas]